LALIGSLFGWSERALHAGFLLPALLAVIGTYQLARHFCSHPFQAALAVLAAPVFVLCATGLMCDVTMLAFWVWAMCFWMEGLKNGSRARMCIAALLIAACALTKYFGIALVPLLLAQALLEKYPVRRWLPWLAAPVVILGLYQWWTFRLYGHGLLGSAAAYAIIARVGIGLPARLLTSFGFVGGCIAVLPAAIPLLWGGRRALAAVPAFILAAVASVLMKKVGVFNVADDQGVRWWYVLQLSLWVVGGMSLGVLAAADWRRHKTPASLLLILWVTGTFVFTSVLNWTVSGRNILPMLPAAALLLIRGVEARASGRGGGELPRLWMPLAFSLGLALLVGWADCRLANSERAAVSVFQEKAGTEAATACFEGHWGFQYYMEQMGATALDQTRPSLKPNQAIVIPVNNSNLFPLPGNPVVWFRYEVESPRWLTTMSGSLGAGYYSDGWGPLPFVFGRVPMGRYLVYRAH
jgi:4-amino-4-deoxy-L-arabinose transferase-like glycosyltransferase